MTGRLFCTTLLTLLYDRLKLTIIPSSLISWPQLNTLMIFSLIVPDPSSAHFLLPKTQIICILWKRHRTIAPQMGITKKINIPYLSNLFHNPTMLIRCLFPSNNRPTAFFNLYRLKCGNKKNSLISVSTKKITDKRKNHNWKSLKSKTVTSAKKLTNSNFASNPHNLSSTNSSKASSKRTKASRPSIRPGSAKYNNSSIPKPKLSKIFTRSSLPLMMTLGLQVNKKSQSSIIIWMSFSKMYLKTLKSIWRWLLSITLGFSVVVLIRTILKSTVLFFKSWSMMNINSKPLKNSSVPISNLRCKKSSSLAKNFIKTFNKFLLKFISLMSTLKRARTRISWP